MDPFALHEGAVLLGNDRDSAALEMAGYGGRFQFIDAPRWIALTGAEMKASIDGIGIPWRTSYLLHPGQVLEIGSVLTGPDQGSYGYLHIAGGISVPAEIGARGVHLRAGVGGIQGRVLGADMELPLQDSDPSTGKAQSLPTPEHLGQRTIRIVWGPHSKRFNASTRDRLLNETFQLSHQRDRMAMRLALGENQAPFEALLTGLSDPVQDGDIQMTGDGVPAILVREHQPTGGYPRIASVISADLAAVAQLPSAVPFRFELVSLDQAIEALARWRAMIQHLSCQRQPIPQSGVDQFRGDIRNLLDYNLIGGVVSADDS